MSEDQDPLLAGLQGEENQEQQQGTNGESSNAQEEQQPQPTPAEQERQKALQNFKEKLTEHRKWDARLKEMRLSMRDMEKTYDKTENDIKALQSVGQIVGEVLKQLTDETFIVKASSGPRYIVGCRNTIKKENLKNGVRVSLDMTTLTIMRILPREVDPLVYNMTTFEPGEISFNGIGGLTEQIRELREVIELPLKNPELFTRVGIKPPRVFFCTARLVLVRHCWPKQWPRPSVPTLSFLQHLLSLTNILVSLQD